jgi:hypothetical protein
VVGNRQLLREEMTAAPFAVSINENDTIEGYLQDVIRARS